MLKKLSGWLLLATTGMAFAEAKLEVSVEPASKALKENIEAYIGDLEDRDAEALRRYERAVKAQVEQASQALGYYHAEISTEVVEGDKPTLKVKVQRGQPVRLGVVNIEVRGPAAELKAFQFEPEPKLEPGARLDHSLYEGRKSDIQNAALRLGFFQGKFIEHALVIDPAANLADIHLVFESGPRYLLGEVSFNDDSKINQDLLQRLVPFKAGEPYNSARVAKLTQNLQETGYFADVRVDASDKNASSTHIIPVQVTALPAKPRTMGLGFGYSTDVGVRGRFSWERHRVNRAGHKYGFDAELSAPRQNVTTWYQIPLTSPLSDHLRFFGGYERRELIDADTERATLGLQWQKQVKWDWQRIVGLRYEQEKFDFGGNTKKRTTEFLMPSVVFSKLKSDSPLDPSHGYRAQLDVRMAREGFLADADLVYVNALVKGLTTVADRHRFLGRFEIGAIDSNNYDKVPPSMRFFAGGDQSIRGYAFETLSPRDAEGNRIGGRYLLATSAEYQYGITDKWRVATFVDHGNSVDSWSDSMKTSAGIGVRWVSPIGPLRLDYAQPINDKDKGWRIHFSMGPEL